LDQEGTSVDAEMLAARSSADTRHILKAGGIISGLHGVSKGVALVREATVAAVFGANRGMDAFLVANAVVSLCSTWIAGPVREAFIPVFSRKLHREGEKTAWEAASNLLNTLVVTGALMIAILFVSSHVVVRLFSAGFHDPQTWAKSARLTQLLAVSVAFSVIDPVLGSLQNIYRRQVVPALAAVAQSLVVLAAVYFLGPQMGLTAYALGIVGGAITTVFVQSAVLYGQHHPYRPVLKPLAPVNKEVGALALPLFIGLAGTRLDIFIDRNLASFLPEGQLTVLYFATALSAVSTEVVTNIWQSIFLPFFAQLVAEGRLDELRSRVLQALRVYLYFLTPVTAFLCAGSGPLVQLLYERGRFTAENAALTARILPFLALGAPAFGASLLLSHVFISNGDPRTPMKVGFWRLGFKVVVSLTLFPFLGAVGLAMATSASILFRAVLLWRRLEARLRPDSAALASLLGRLSLSGMVAAGGVWLVSAALASPTGGLWPKVLCVGVGTATAVVVHVAVAWFLGERLLKDLLRLVLSRGERT
jgi:putative peptidoglycan lipid II flippase